MFKIIVNINTPTRFELNAKNYVIFKDFHLKEEKTGNCFPPATFTNWMFAKFKEDENSNIEVIDEVKVFDTLQQAFDHAQSKQLEFL
jgi:hypothetical protein